MGELHCVCQEVGVHGRILLRLRDRGDVNEVVVGVLKRESPVLAVQHVLEGRCIHRKHLEGGREGEGYITQL